MENLLNKDSYIEILKKENEELKNQNQELQERLSKYTNPGRTKQYQERNKDKIKEYQKEWYNKKKLENELRLKNENNLDTYIKSNNGT